MATANDHLKGRNRIKESMIQSQVRAMWTVKKGFNQLDEQGNLKIKRGHSIERTGKPILNTAEAYNG
jgi:hypothetical protein